MNVLVTGSSGRIGESVAKALEASGYSVIGIDKRDGRFTSYLGDICNTLFIENIIKQCDYIVHTAAYHAPHVGLISDQEFYKVVLATKEIANLAVKLGVKKIIFTSSTAVYGHASKAQNKAVWVDEATIPMPKTIYHTTKIEAEDYLNKIALEHNLSCVLIRMSRCFAEPANHMAVYRLHRGIDRRDVARAHLLALENEKLPVFERFVISGETPFCFSACEELFSNPSSQLMKTSPNLVDWLKEIKMGLPNSIDRVYDSSKAKKLLGWHPKYGFEELIKQHSSNSPEVLPPKEWIKDWIAE